MNGSTMNKCHVLHFIGFLLLTGNQDVARAFPTDSQEIVGVNVGGLHADFKTNLFSPDGPLAQLGNEITSGAAQLQNELTSGAQALQADFNNAANFLSQGSQEELAGINLGGLHADLSTNIFSKTGPLAQIGGELEAGANALENDLKNGANALQESLTGAASAIQAKLAGGADLLTNGLQDLGNQITSATGGVSLDNLFKGSGDLFSNMGASLGSNGNAVEKDSIEFTGEIPGSNTQISGIPGISLFGQVSGLPNSNSQKTSETSKVLITGQTSGIPKVSANSQITGGLKGFTFNMASDQEPRDSSGEKNEKQTNGISAKLQGNTNGATITRTITTGTNTVLTPELLAEIYKKLNLADVCKAVNK
ncbi:uncharacterized protein LOC123319923 [Coccinella septempunctata]|uniref:uncharacterized protein LOC123319923 n=1 Tax=Coccinella septempunctata TaxID=41139 RepID=UPI001D0644FB|nr:uncharacterized protein LOC123319923 [Coccinella septempunctata]